MKNNFKKLEKQKKGFTLIETLVAIAILVTGVIGPLSIAYQGVSLSLLARDQITASFLAQEGLEFVRFRIGTNHNLGETGNGLINPVLGDNSYSLFECSWEDNGGNYCMVDPFETDPGLAIVSCGVYGGVCPYLKYDSGSRKYSFSGDDTNFRRSVRVNYNISSPDEFQVESKVEWGKPGNIHTLVLKEVIMDWQK